MKINDNEVVLTKHERSAAVLRDLFSEQGINDHDSALTALDLMTGRMSKQFVEWLSKGTLTIEGGEVKDADVQPETSAA